VVCAAPAYLKRRGTPQTPSDLLQHDCLVFNDLPGSVDWRFLSAAGRDNVRVVGRLWANSLDVVVAAARAGAGIVRAPSWQVAADLAAGRLIRILADYERPATPVSLLFQPARLAAPKIRLFVDYLVEHWNRQQELAPLAPSQPASEQPQRLHSAARNQTSE
jgi:DNA-binding transcriptional LysR family regulator